MGSLRVVEVGPNLYVWGHDELALKGNMEAVRNFAVDHGYADVMVVAASEVNLPPELLIQNSVEEPPAVEQTASEKFEEIPAVGGIPPEIEDEEFVRTFARNFFNTLLSMDTTRQDLFLIEVTNLIRHEVFKRNPELTA